MNIEVIASPNENLEETGFGSIKACNSVVNSIKRLGFDAILTICRTEADLQAVVKRRPSLVMLAVKYISIPMADDIWISEYFSNNGINHSGSSRLTLNFDSKKIIAKTHLKKKGIKTARFFTVIPGQFEYTAALPLGFPLFLKPTDAANGNGVDEYSLVNNFEEFEEKVLSLHQRFKQPILAEEYLDGREFTAAIIQLKGTGLITSIVEIIPPISANGLRILGEQEKKDDSEDIIAISDEFILEKVRSLAISSFVGLGVRDFGRIDIKANKQGDCFFMEANLVPGMTEGSSYFPLACQSDSQLSYDNVIKLIVESCINRTNTSHNIDKTIENIPSLATSH